MTETSAFSVVFLASKKRREVAPRPELRDAQVQLTEPGVERPVAVAVAPGRALAAALISPGADHPLHVRLHEDLQHGLGEAAQEIPVIGLLQRFHQRHPVVGHRVLVGLGLKSANSTLTAHPDGHLAYTKNSTTSVDANSMARGWSIPTTCGAR